MWLEEHQGSRINKLRIGQAVDVKAKLLAVACPWCLQMLEDGTTATTEPLRVVDIAELVEEQLRG
jgi:Fe-S oxidoreductase